MHAALLDMGDLQLMVVSLVVPKSDAGIKTKQANATTTTS